MELRIQQIRKQRGITQADLARTCETTQQQIAKIESGLVDLKLSTLRRIASALSCQLPDLFYTRKQFFNDVTNVVRSQKVNIGTTPIIKLNRMCFEVAQIPLLHPYWEQISVKNNRLCFQEEE